MARDYEDLHNLDDLNDDELRQVVREHLAGNNTIDLDDFNVEIRDGRAVLEGRVGTPEERELVAHIITDVVGIPEVENNLQVHAMRRGISSEDIDEHLAEEDRTEGLLLGDRPVPYTAESDHLMDDESDVDIHGTTDIQKAISDGGSWIPPESPTPEGHGDEIGGRG
jgi:hypothetical protein